MTELRGLPSSLIRIVPSTIRALTAFAAASISASRPGCPTARDVRAFSGLGRSPVPVCALSRHPRQFHGFPDVVVEHRPALRVELESQPRHVALHDRDAWSTAKDPVEAGRGDQDRQQRRSRGKQNRRHRSPLYGRACDSSVAGRGAAARSGCRARTQTTDAPNSAVPKVSPVAPTSVPVAGADRRPD